MDYQCEFCNKIYKSYQSLWNHKKIKHNNELNKGKKFNCTSCNKTFTRKFNMEYHVKNSCKKSENKVLDKTIILEKQINNLQKEVTNLKQHALISKDFTNNKTINTGTINNGVVNNGTINNGTINNFIYINKPGTENVLALNDIEIDEIFTKGLTCIIFLIKSINFNERLPSNHSFCTKSLEGKYLLTYDTEESKIISTRKKYFYQEVLENSVTMMELLYKTRQDKLSKDQQKNMLDTIERLKEIKEESPSNKTLIELKNKLVEISYNNRKTVLKTWEDPKNKLEGCKKIETQEEREARELKELAECYTGPATIQHDTTDTSDSSDSEDSDSYESYGLLKPSRRSIK